MFSALIIAVAAIGFAWMCWDSIRHPDKWRVAGEPASPKSSAPQSPADAPLDQPLSPNQQFLHAVRSRSCYPVLRGAHGFLTFAAVIGTGIMWIVLMNTASGEAGIYATFTCGAVIVALLIEYGLFRLIVDAVDVLIDTGRRAAGQQGDAGG